MPLVGFRLPQSELDRLEAEASRRGQTVSEFVRDAVRAALEADGTASVD